MIILAALVTMGLLSAPNFAAATLNVSHLATDAEMLELLSDTLFVGEGRIGDRGGAATFELDLGHDTGDPETTAHYDWQSGVPVPFTLAYNYVTNDVVFTVGGVVLNWTSELSGYSDIFVRTRAVDAGAEILVEDLVLDGELVSDVSFADGDASGLDILWINGGTLGNGFTLSGNVTLTWIGSPPTQSRLAFQIKVGKLKGVATEDTSWGRIKTLYR
jgi:hypothetical protein